MVGGFECDILVYFFQLPVTLQLCHSQWYFLFRAREMVPWLRALSDFTEGLGSLPRTHMYHPVTIVSRDPMHSPDLLWYPVSNKHKQAPLPSVLTKSRSHMPQFHFSPPVEPTLLQQSGLGENWL